MIARDRVRAEETLARLRELGPDAAHRVHYADLSLMADVQEGGGGDRRGRAAHRRAHQQCRQHVRARLITAEGLERTFALNHMSYFVLTHCLREKLVAAPDASSTRPPTRIGGDPSISTTCRPRTATGPTTPMAAPSCATSCSPASWRGGSPAPASPRTACIPDSSRRISASAMPACSDGVCALRCCSPPARARRRHHRPSRELARGRRCQRTAISMIAARSRRARRRRTMQSPRGCGGRARRSRVWRDRVARRHAASPRACAAAARIAAILLR